MTAIAQGPSTPHLRLTRRGRVVFTTLLAAPLVALALYLGLNAGGAVATGSGGTADFETVTVEPGQSLWDVAATVAPEADPREVIADIASLNRLDSAVVQPGQELAIPFEYAR